MNFEGKVAIITGASSGIGAALAEGLAARGADLALCARRADRLRELKAKLNQDVFIFPCDVTREEDLKNFTSETLKKFGKIDIVIANAGFGVSGTFENLNPADYRLQFETNIFGVLHTAAATLEALKKSQGTLVLIGSVAGFIGTPGASAYSMSKAAIHSLAQALYHEFSPYGVSVVQISPGFIESEIRAVDNQGKHHAHTKDPIPSWLVLPAQKAALKILKAIYQKKRTAVITSHGKILVFLHRHFPWFVDFMIRRFSIKNRPEPKI